MRTLQYEPALKAKSYDFNARDLKMDTNNTECQANLLCDI